jgi:MFS family permease
MSLSPSRARIVEGLIFGTILLDFVGFSILIPVLPIYARNLGATEIEVGLLLSLYSLALVLFLPLWGWISDRVGRRPVILVCLLGTSGYFGLLSIAVTVPELYLARVVGGFFGASIGVAQAYMTDITSGADRTRGMGLIGAAVGVAFVVGPAMGGVLYSVHPLLPFYATALLALANFGLAVWLLPEPKRVRSVGGGWRGLARALVPTPIQVFAGAHENRTRLYLYLFFHIFACFSALEAMFPLYASDSFGWSPLDVGLFLAYVGVVIGVTQGLLIGPLSRAWGEVPLVALGLAMTGGAMALLPAAHSLEWLMVVGAAIAFGNGVGFPAFTSLFSKVCGGEQAGEYLGHSQSMAQTGRALGPYWGGWAMGSVGVGAPFLLGGLGILAGLGVFLARRGFLDPRTLDDEGGEPQGSRSRTSYIPPAGGS